MKWLYFCRHAKSSWADPGMADFDRPLNERGLRNAPLMARLFKQRQEPIDLIISSPAVRALTTARFFANELPLPEKQFITDPRIYEATVHTLLNVVHDLPEAVGRVMLFGHNPGFSDVVEAITGGGAGDLPTCALVRIDLHVNEWQAVLPGTGSIAWIDHPKKHESD